MKTQRKYYAKYDWMTSRNNPGHGFSNSEGVRVFFSKKERDDYVENREWFDYSCEAIKRPEALKMAGNYDDKKFIMYRKDDYSEERMVFI